MAVPRDLEKFTFHIEYFAHESVEKRMNKMGRIPPCTSEFSKSKNLSLIFPIDQALRKKSLIGTKCPNNSKNV